MIAVPEAGFSATAFLGWRLWPGAEFYLDPEVVQGASLSHLQGLGALNIFISLAAFGLGLAQLIFAYNFLVSLFRGPKAEQNPWEGTTLEWQTPSPPPQASRALVSRFSTTWLTFAG